MLLRSTRANRYYTTELHQGFWPHSLDVGPTLNGPQEVFRDSLGCAKSRNTQPNSESELKNFGLFSLHKEVLRDFLDTRAAPVNNVCYVLLYVL